MNKLLLSAMLLGFCGLLAGCGGDASYVDERYPLSGQVTYDGQPLDWGAVTFIPLEGDQQRVSGGVIKDGSYNVPEAKGANAGRYRVEIHWGKLTGRQIKAQDSEDLVDERIEGLPTKFNKNSELTVEVSQDQTTFDFHLKSQ